MVAQEQIIYNGFGIPALDYHIFLSVCQIYDVEIDALFIEKFTYCNRMFRGFMSKEFNKKNTNSACDGCIKKGTDYCKNRKCPHYEGE